MTDRTDLESQDAIEAKVLNRKIRKYGGVLVGVAGVGIAIFNSAQIIPGLIAAILGFGLADFSEVAGFFKRG